MTENPLIPMGAVTGRPSREFIRKRLTEYREAGITQYLIYPRSGCEVEYCSEEWFDLCRTILEEAEKLRFTSVWLYDDFNYPSGQAGGRVPAAGFKSPVLTLKKNHDGVIEPVVSTPTDDPDVLNPDAVKLFMELTHEAYYKHLGKYFGTLVKGIFTDEPSPGYTGSICGDSCADLFDPSGNRLLPWYDGVEDDYHGRYGREMRDDLDAPGFIENYLLLIGERFRKVYLTPVAGWCSEHHILLTGHLMREESVRKGKHYNGDILFDLAEFTLPGMDDIMTLVSVERSEWLTYSVAQYAARKRGGGLAELFAIGPADLPPSKMRQMISLVGMFGIDHYVMAVAQLDFRGNIGKAGWFNPISADQPWFSEYMPLLGEAAKNCADIARKKPVREIAVRYPESEFAEAGELLRHLVRGQRPWHLLNTREAPAGDEVEILRILPGNRIVFEKADRIVSVSETVELLDRLSPAAWRIRRPDGELARDLLVREYGDGSLAVLDLSDSTEERDLVLSCRNRAADFRFSLPQWGMKILPVWSVKRESIHIFTPRNWHDGLYSFVTTDGLSEISIAYRTYGKPVKIRLDGELLRGGEAAEFLPTGFAGLYRMPTLPKLAAGSHTLELVEGDDSYPFLPTVWIGGDFAYFPGRDLLTVDSGDGSGLACYSGTVSQNAFMTIPEDALSFKITGNGQLCAELLFDGVSLGRKISAPFRWKIPAEFRGKTVAVAIRRSTSILSMIDYHDWTFGPAHGLDNPVVGVEISEAR